VLHKNKLSSKLVYQLLVSTHTISKRNVRYLDIHLFIYEDNVVLFVADEEKNEETKVKITHNEACVLQNQVRQKLK
jgi:hypothetical protein